MNLRAPNGSEVERYCDDCLARDYVRATRVITLRYGAVSVCDDCFTNLAIALSLAVTEEHPEEDRR